MLENTASTETANAWSGQVRPGFSNKVNAEVINPFIKIGGAEFFGNFETATGGAFTEPKLRTLHQNVYEGLYRLGERQVLRRRPVQHAQGSADLEELRRIRR